MTACGRDGLDRPPTDRSPLASALAPTTQIVGFRLAGRRNPTALPADHTTGWSSIPQRDRKHGPRRTRLAAPPQRGHPQALKLKQVLMKSGMVIWPDLRAR
jgi:hypothetical protein